MSAKQNPFEKDLKTLNSGVKKVVDGAKNLKSDTLKLGQDVKDKLGGVRSGLDGLVKDLDLPDLSQEFDDTVKYVNKLVDDVADIADNSAYLQDASNELDNMIQYIEDARK